MNNNQATGGKLVLDVAASTRSNLMYYVATKTMMDFWEILKDKYEFRFFSINLLFIKLREILEVL